MAVIVAKEIVKDTKEMRGALSEALIARAKDNKNLVYLDADLSSSMSIIFILTFSFNTVM